MLMDWLVKDEAAKQLRLARNPTGRFGKPEEIVNVAIYLASDESRWTNGAHFVIDGGHQRQLLLAGVQSDRGRSLAGSSHTVGRRWSVFRPDRLGASSLACTLNAAS